jgi:predicted TIM-barrel fold metal-dependent hydrolase
MQIVDAHHHFWDLQRNYHPWLRDEPMIPFRYGDYSSIRKNYLPDDLQRDAQGFEIIASVYVEAEWDPSDPIGETAWIHQIAASHGLPCGVVAQAWLDAPDAEQVLAAQAAFALVRSVRHKPRSAPSPDTARRGQPGSMDDERWRRGFARLQGLGLHFDLQTPWWHLDAAAQLAADFPDIRIILNHTGLPADRSDDGLRRWRAALEQLASHHNTCIKISGIGLPGLEWTVERNGPVVRDAIAIFGVERAMFASNFPVDSVIGSYHQIFDGFRRIVADRPDVDRQRLFCDNALEIYRLTPRTRQTRTDS